MARHSGGRSAASDAWSAIRERVGGDVPRENWGRCKRRAAAAAARREAQKKKSLRNDEGRP